MSLEDTGWKNADVVFLFHPQERPGISDLKLATAHIDGAYCGEELRAARGSELLTLVELRQNGLTYDCVGLAPGPPFDLSASNHALDLPDSDEKQLLESVGLALSPHVRAGQASLPVLKAFLAFAGKLAARLKGVAGVCWTASGRAMSSAAFASLSDGWESKGAVPLPILFGSKDAIDGGMESRGLRYFTGQELRFEPDFVSDRERAEQLNLRLAERLLHSGRLDTVEQVTAPDGIPLWLEPSPNGRFVRVRAG